LVIGSGKSYVLLKLNVAIDTATSDEVLFQARINPEQYCNTFSDEQIKTLHEKLVEVCTIACETLAESERFPENWLMRYRWKKGTKESSTLPTGEKIIHLTVSGRTSAVVPTLQKKTGPVAGDVSVSQRNGDDEDEEEGVEKPKAKKSKKATKKEKDEGVANGVAAGKSSKRGRGKTDIEEESDDTDDQTQASKKQKKTTPAKSGTAKPTPDSGRRRSGRVAGK
jgi:formamidopyrimidine-DNA glycosylase